MSKYKNEPDYQKVCQSLAEGPKSINSLSAETGIVLERVKHIIGRLMDEGVLSLWGKQKCPESGRNSYFYALKSASDAMRTAEKEKENTEQLPKITQESSSINPMPEIIITEVNEMIKGSFEKPLKYKESMVDLTIDVPEPVSVIKQGDCVIFSRGNISTIGGKAKSRKTFLIILLSADFLNSSSQGKVLIVDTEMAKAHTYKTARRVHRLMGWDTNINNERLTVLSLREYLPDERVAFLVEAIQDKRPELVFIDGIRDLVKDFNNVEESTNTVGLLMKLSAQYDCHICSILHENQGNDKLRGHLGTEVINKSETVMSIKKNGDTSTVEPQYTRNMPFDDFSFRVNEAELPEYCDTPKIEKSATLFKSILNEGQAMSKKELISALCIATGKCERTSRRQIDEALESKSILMNRQGCYYLPNFSDDDRPPF